MAVVTEALCEASSSIDGREDPAVTPTLARQARPAGCMTAARAFLRLCVRGQTGQTP
jgi:hypothetical protein